MDSSSNSVAEGDNRDASITTTTSSASALSIFHEDILHHILSYVSDVPFELSESGGARDNSWPTDGQSTLTHTLPLVCKLFHKLTSNDMYWKVSNPLLLYYIIFMQLQLLPTLSHFPRVHYFD